MAAVDPGAWRFRRALARIEPAIEAIVAEHATTYWQRGARRRELEPGADGNRRVRWSIDDQLVLELHVPPRGRATLVAHDFSLHDPLRQSLRTRHLHLRFATHRDDPA
jgi:hypothetical protein